MIENVYMTFTSLNPSVLIFPSLFATRTFVDKKRPGPPGKPYYSAKFGLRLNPEHADWGPLKAMLYEAANQAWGNVSEAPNERGQIAKIEYPIEFGDAIADKAKAEGKDREAFRGLVCISTTTGEGKPVGLAHMPGGISTDIATSGPERAEFEKLFFGGANVHFVINIHPRLSFGNPHVKAYLQFVRAAGGGDPVKAFSAGGVQSASAAFGAQPATHTGHVSNVAPLG